MITEQAVRRLLQYVQETNGACRRAPTMAWGLRCRPPWPVPRCCWCCTQCPPHATGSSDHACLAGRTAPSQGIRRWAGGAPRRAQQRLTLPRAAAAAAAYAQFLNEYLYEHPFTPTTGKWHSPPAAQGPGRWQPLPASASPAPASAPRGRLTAPPPPLARCLQMRMPGWWSWQPRRY